MKLKLLAPFLSPGLLVRTEMPVDRPRRYAQLWDRIEKSYGEPPVELPPWRRRLVDVRFTHGSRFLGSPGNRYRSIDTDSLTRPLHVLEVYPDPAVWDPGALFQDALAVTTPDGGSESARLLAPLAERLRARPPRLLIRVHDHAISLAEADLDLGELLWRIPENEDEDPLPAVLDHLQQAVIEWMERAIDACQEKILDPLFEWVLGADPQADRYLWEDTASYETGSGRVLWVTRTLVLTDGPAAEGTEDVAQREDRQQDRRRERRDIRRKAIVDHWLKDVSGSARGETRIEKAMEQTDAYSLRWLNYLFRKDAYPSPYPEDGWQRPGPDQVVQPFCRPWEAIINAQYYYAAFDILQTRIYRVLAHSYTPESRYELRRLKHELDEMVKESTLLILDYQENFKYYQRAVHTEMTEILRYWSFESVLLKQVAEAVEACQERVAELHTRATARSSVYTDLILLAIGVTSVFGILLTLLEYGRNLAHDVNLAVYERGSFNFVDWMAAHSTDGILLVATIVSGGLVGLYFYFKRQQLL